jgi:NHLM bacteriocin system ABC transporter ATP-binding protein
MLHDPVAIFARAGAHRRAIDGRDHLDLGAERGAHAVASGMLSVFVAVRRADGSAGRRLFLGTVAPGGLLPSLAGRLVGSSFTLVAVADGRASVLPEPAAGNGVAEAVAEGTESFARVMLPMEARVGVAGTDPVAALLERAAAIAMVDTDSLAGASHRRAGQSAALHDRFQRMLATVFAAQEELLNVDPTLPPMLRACRHVAVESGVPLRSIPRRIPADHLLGPAESFAHAARIGCRSVRLPAQWWKGNFGPLLGTTRDGAPVALIPGAWGTYRAFVYLPAAQPMPMAVDAVLAEGMAPEALVFAPPLPATASTLRSLLAFLLRGSAHDLWLAGLVSLLAGILNLAVPFATGLLVNSIIPSAEPQGLWYLGALLATSILAVAACELVTRFLLLRVETRAVVRGSSAILLRTLSLPLSFFQRHSVGDLAERLGVVEELQRRITGTMVLAIVGGIFSFTYLALMAVIDPLAAAVSAAAFVGILATTAFIARRQSSFAADAAERSGRLRGFTLEALHGIDRIRTTGTEEQALLQWLQRFRPERLAMYGASIAGAQLRVLAVCVPFAAAAFLWWRFGGGAGRSESQVASFMAYNAAFMAAFAAITSLGYAIGDLSEVLPLLARLRPILEERPESAPGAETAGQLTGSVSLQGVRFAFPGSSGELLRGVSLEAAPGDFVAVVGSSGCGKSTLAQLILGLRRPTAGKVLFDGQDLDSLDLVSVRRQIGVVGQHARVIPGSILENIVGATLLSQDDAWEAAEASGLADDIREMPMQMHTFVSEQTLSGGQLQKLLIARALVTRPRILLFDEATSALDEVSQAHVSRSLEERSVTRIVIAHRLSTVRAADRIHVLVDGQVAQTGRFDELAAEEGPFRELVRRQLLEEPAAGGGAG